MADNEYDPALEEDYYGDDDPDKYEDDDDDTYGYDGGYYDGSEEDTDSGDYEDEPEEDDDTKELVLYSTNGEVLFKAEVTADNYFDDQVLEAMRQAKDDGVDISTLRFPETNYCEIDFSNLDLSHADFSGQEFSNCDFKSCDLSYVNATNAFFGGCDFNGVDLSQATLTGASFDRCDFYDAKLGNIGTEIIFDGGYFNCRSELPGYTELPEGQITMYKAAKVARADIMNRIGKVKWLKLRNADFKVVLELLVPTDAERTGTFPQSGKIYKCRVSHATPVAVYLFDHTKLDVSEVGSPFYNGSPPYVIGTQYVADSFDGNPLESCGHGINCFRTFEEAVAYFAEFN